MSADGECLACRLPGDAHTELCTNYDALRAENERLKKERDDLQTLNKDVTKHRDALAQHHDELGAILIAAGVQPQTTQRTIIHPTVDLLQQQLAEADRRAGAAERELDGMKKDAARLAAWTDRAKDQWFQADGYGPHRNVSFDTIWEECLQLKKQLADRQALMRELEEIHQQSEELRQAMTKAVQPGGNS